jgi:hypothetical protein
MGERPADHPGADQRDFASSHEVLDPLVMKAAPGGAAKLAAL